MHYLVFENVQISFVIILFTYIGTSYSASLFGLDFSAADTDVKTRYDGMSQTIIRHNHNEQKTNSNYGSISPFPHNDHFYQSNFHTPISSTPTPKHFMDNFKLKTELPRDKLTHNQNAGTNQSYGSLNSNDELRNTNPIDQSNQKTNISEEDADDDGYDYTDETSNYETTTEEELNRIGAPAPAVVATLLG